MTTYDITIFVWKGSMQVSFISQCSNEWNNLMPSFNLNDLKK